jgi:type II secretion system protein I
LSRRGITLFEVVLAVAIFLGSAVALSQLYSTGSRASIRARLHADAVIHAESKMAEVASGVLPVTAVANQSFEDPDLAAWSWSINVAAGPHIDLLAVDVTVTRQATNNMGQVSYSLRRYVRDPQLFLDAAMQAAATSESSSSETSSP